LGRGPPRPFSTGAGLELLEKTDVLCQRGVSFPGRPSVNAPGAVMRAEPETPKHSTAEIPAELHFFLPPFST